MADSRKPSTPRRPMPKFASSPRGTPSRRDECQVRNDHGAMIRNIREGMGLLSELKAHAQVQIAAFDDLLQAQAAAGTRSLTPSRVEGNLVPAAANNFSSSTSRMSSPAPPIQSSIPTATASMSPSPHCHFPVIACPPVAQSCHGIVPTACHTVHRLPNGEFVDQSGHKVQMAQHCEVMTYSGEKIIPGKGVSNVVQAIYKEAYDKESTEAKAKMDRDRLKSADEEMVDVGKDGKEAPNNKKRKQED